MSGLNKSPNPMCTPYRPSPHFSKRCRSSQVLPRPSTETLVKAPCYFLPVRTLFTFSSTTTTNALSNGICRLSNFLNAPLIAATTRSCYFLLANSLFTFSSICTTTEAGDAFPSRTC